MAELLGGLDDALGGTGRLFLVVGEPGIGKSRLADEVAGQARLRGLSVCWGRCWEAGGAPAYWPWVQVMRAWLRGREPDAVRQAVGGAAVDVVQLLPEVSHLFPGLSSPASADPESARFQLFDSTATFLRNAATADPLVLVLEDLHAADTPSLLFLRFLATQLAPANVMVLATYRDIELSPEHPLTAVVADLAREPPTRLIHLRGLGEDDVGRLVAAAGIAPTPPLASALFRETNGNPLFIKEAVRLLSAEGKMGRVEDVAALRLIVPRGVRDVIARRLGHLDGSCREMLSVASVLGTDFTTEALSRLCGKPDGDELRELLDRAVDNGLVGQLQGSLGRWRFSHGLVRETLYGELPSAQRMQQHRRAAAVLQAVYASDEASHLAELAHHFFEAAPLGDVATAVGFCRRAAEAAASSLAYEEAARLYGMALTALELDQTRDAGLVTELLLAEGDASARAGDLAGARETFFRAAGNARQTGDARQLGLAALGYGGRFQWARVGDDPHLVGLLQDALLLLGGDDDRLRVRLLSRLACALRSSPTRERSDTLSRQALEIARGLEDPATLAYALVGRCWAVAWPENPQVRLELATELIGVAEEAGDTERVVEGHLARCDALATLGAVSVARLEIEDMSRKAKELRQPAQLWLVGVQQTIYALMEGDFDRAERLIASEVRPGQPPTLASDDLSLHQMHRFLLARERGQLAEVEEGARAAADQLSWYPVHRAALACLLVELGRQAEAAVVFHRLAANGFQAVPRDSEWLMGLCLAGDACAGLGDTEAADVLYEQLSPFDGRHALGFGEGSVGAVSRYLGLLAHTLGRREDAVGHLRDAITINEQLGARPWSAHSRFDLANVLLARDGPGDREQAAAELRLAADACEALGMPVLADKISSRLDIRDTAHAPAPLADTGPSVLRREGEYWTVLFATDAFRLRDAKGLHYLAELLAHPGREFHVLDLVGAVEGIGPGRSRTGAGRQDGLNVRTSSDVGPALDERAKASYRARLRELEEELDEATSWADSGRAARVREEMEFLADELTAAVGLGGRDRKAGSPAERARVNITRAIHSALGRIRDHSAVLAEHLDATVHTGTFCSYVPDPRSPISWQR
jgi:tetratricopeptide (TPR) repeat protein